MELRRRGKALGRRLLVKRGRSGVEGRRAFVAPGESAVEQLAHARAEGIRRLARMRPMGRTLRLTEADARALFPDGPSAEAVALPTDLIDQLDDLFPTTGGTSRLADLLTACRAEHVAAAVGASGSVDSDADSSESPPATETLLARAADGTGGASNLLQALAGVLAGRPGSVIAPRPGVADIGADLATNVPPGPADTTAYYDFHRLQVAWLDTWTAAMDGMTVGAVSELYESLVDTVDATVIPVDDSEIDELEDLLQDVADAISVSAGVPGLSAPAELLTWYPGLAVCGRHSPPRTRSGSGSSSGSTRRCTRSSSGLPGELVGHRSRPRAGRHRR